MRCRSCLAGLRCRCSSRTGGSAMPFVCIPSLVKNVVSEQCAPVRSPMREKGAARSAETDEWFRKRSSAHDTRFEQGCPKPGGHGASSDQSEVKAASTGVGRLDGDGLCVSLFNARGYSHASYPCDV